jgi:hypothetical protein
MADTKIDQAILGKEGSDAPLVYGDFTLYEVSIHTPSSPNAPLHLNSPTMFVQLDIYEDLFSNVLKGEYTFKDTQGWAELIPLIGDETLVVSYATPGAGGTQVDTQSQDPTSQTASEEIFEQRFKVFDCVEVGTGDRLKIYKLSLISEEYMFSKKMKVSKGYRGRSYSYMTKDVMKKLNKESENLNKKLYIEETRSQQNAIVPNWTPFQAINFFASRSLSADIEPVDQEEGSENPPPTARPTGSLFVFYEKFGTGFFYESIESMILKQKLKDNIPLYQYSPKLAENTIFSSSLQYFSVEQFDVVSSFRTLENLGRGMFGSRLIAYDPIRMKYEDVKYDYYEKTADDTNETHDQNIDVTTTSTNVEQADDSQRVFSDFTATDTSAIDFKPNKFISSKSDYVGSNNASIKLATTTQEHGEMFVAPGAESFGTGATAITINPVTSIGVSSKTFKDKESKQNNVEDWLLQRQAQVSEFGNIIVTFTVPGNTSRHVGDLIEFAVPTHIPDDDSGISSVQFGHQLYSGYYLISKIRHIITNEKFEMDLELIKNSFAKRIPGQETDLDAGLDQAKSGSRMSEDGTRIVGGL